MTETKGNVDVFGSYLSRISGGPDMSSGSESGSSPETRILKMLTFEQRPVPIKYLMARLQLEPSLLMKALGSLVETRLVEMSTTDEDEVVTVTELGQRLVA